MGSFTIGTQLLSWFTYQVAEGILVRDRRQSIISASLAILRERGYAGFTPAARVQQAAGFTPKPSDLLLPNAD